MDQDILQGARIRVVLGGSLPVVSALPESCMKAGAFGRSIGGAVMPRRATNVERYGDTDGQVTGARLEPNASGLRAASKS
jgi:hypothetical protein